MKKDVDKTGDLRAALNKIFDIKKNVKIPEHIEANIKIETKGCDSVDWD